MFNYSSSLFIIVSLIFKSGALSGGRIVQLVHFLPLFEKIGSFPSFTRDIRDMRTHPGKRTTVDNVHLGANCTSFPLWPKFCWDFCFEHFEHLASLDIIWLGTWAFRLCKLVPLKLVHLLQLMKAVIWKKKQRFVSWILKKNRWWGEDLRFWISDISHRNTDFDLYRACIKAKYQNDDKN